MEEVKQDFVSLVDYRSLNDIFSLEENGNFRDLASQSFFPLCTEDSYKVKIFVPVLWHSETVKMVNR